MEVYEVHFPAPKMIHVSQENVKPAIRDEF